MKKIIFILIIASLSLFAETRGYLGLGINLTSVNTKTISKNKFSAIILKAGYDLNNYLGVEVRGGSGVSDGKKLKLKSYVGAYIKPMKHLYKNISTYGLLGVSRTKVGTTTDSREALQNDFSYGLGFNFQSQKNISLYLDAIQICDKKDEYGELKVQQFGMGIAYNFKFVKQKKRVENIDFKYMPKPVEFYPNSFNGSDVKINAIK